MISRVRCRGRRPLRALAAGLGVWVVCASSGMADGGGTAAVKTCPMGHKGCNGRHAIAAQSAGTLGYGPPGLYPGYQGFSLRYHPGYGYGGDALGVGAGGGYPFYGGPGYPHPGPILQRVGGIAPFPYFGGPGYPTSRCPNYFGGVGPLTPDPPVVTFERDPGAPGSDGGYGCFDGMMGDPESTFAPFVTRAAERGTTRGAGSDSLPQATPNTVPAQGAIRNEASPVPSLGIDARPVAEPARGLKLTAVSGGGLAEKAGLRAGDVILTINGYLTEQVGHLAWVIANADPDQVLNMSVLAASDGSVHTHTVRLR